MSTAEENVVAGERMSSQGMSEVTEPPPRRRIWFITGATKGLGREWVTAALERGDSVAGAGRHDELLSPLCEEFGDRLLPLRLDVADRSAVISAVNQAHDHFGGLDVVVNSAGWGLNGMLEEVSEQDIRDQFDTNCFGALWVTQAALPFLRTQGGGRIIQVSSIGGIVSFPALGAYCASKWALEALSEALAEEVRAFGVRVTIVEPTGYATSGYAAARTADPLPAYDEFRKERAAATQDLRFGDPAATRAALLMIVDSDDPPLRLFLGHGPLAMATAAYADRLENWRAWESVSVAASGLDPD
jgi:NAD(P)-dependent dehydrogenase (short-subunit alcohol dehydrogenase family)